MNENSKPKSKNERRPSDYEEEREYLLEKFRKVTQFNNYKTICL